MRSAMVLLVLAPLMACASAESPREDEEVVGRTSQAQHTVTDPAGGGNIPCPQKPMCEPGEVAFKYRNIGPTGVESCGWACCDSGGGGGCDL